MNSQNDRGSTHLHVAAQQGFDDCVKLLIDLGADPSLRNIKKQLPVEFCKKSSTKAVLAAATGRQPTQSEAVSSNKNPGEEFARLSLACMRGDRAIIRDLVENNRSFLTEKSSYRDTPFHIACSSGNAEIAQLRLELGADPKALNIRSKTGFEEAAISGFSNFPEHVAELGNNSCQCTDAAKEYDSGTRLSYSDLQYACARNNIDKVRDILSKRLGDQNVNKVNVYGDTALHYAARSGSVGIVKLLLDIKANVNACSSSSGDTPVIFAIRGIAKSYKL